MKKVNPVERFTSLFQGNEALGLEVGLANSVTCFGIVGTDTRATS